MYRLLLCYRYLRTRYVALASVVSVTLGVATLVVVNSVMAGFADEMQDRLHGLVSDIVIERHGGGGIPNPQYHIDEIIRVCGDQVASHTASVHVPAMLNIDFNNQKITRHVSLVGLDVESYNRVSDFGAFLLHPANRSKFSFQLRKDGFAPGRKGFPQSGWVYRRQKPVSSMSTIPDVSSHPQANDSVLQQQAAVGPKIGFAVPTELLNEAKDAGTAFDPAKDQYPGIVLGIATSTNPGSSSAASESDHYYCRPGDDVQMTFPNASDQAKAVSQKFTVVDLYESGMSEYDGAFAFCRLDQLQEYRGMVDPETEVRNVTTIQLKLNEARICTKSETCCVVAFRRTNMATAFKPGVSYRGRWWKWFGCRRRS